MVRAEQSNDRIRKSTSHIRRGIVFVGLILNVVMTVFVLSIGSLKLDELKLDPGRTFVLLGLLGFPAVLAFLSLRDRPAMLTEAGITSILLVPLSFAGATGPMAIVGILYLVARAGTRTHGSLMRSIFRVVVTSLSFVLALIALLALGEDRCIYSQTGSSCTDAAVSPLGGLVAFGALAIGLWVSKTWSRDTQRGGSGVAGGSDTDALHN